MHAETINCKGRIVCNPDEVIFVLFVVVIVMSTGMVLQCSTPSPIAITVDDCYFVPVISVLIFLGIAMH